MRGRLPSESPESLSEVVETPGELKFAGYVSSRYGSLCIFVVMLVNISWMVLFLVIIIGYYNKCEFTSIDNACFYGDYFIFGSYNANSRVPCACCCRCEVRSSVVRRR